MQQLSYQKLKPFQSSVTRDKLTSEQRFWKKYQDHVLETSTAPINTLSANNQKQILAYGHSRTLTIADSGSKQILREINSTQAVSGVCVRSDGVVLAYSDESGKIEVIDTKQKFHLRTFKNHKKRVCALEYVGNDLYSGGDDFMVRHYDVSVGELVHSYQNAHSDYVRGIKALQNNHILTAAYDGFIKLFDFRVHEQAQLSFYHQEQLESIALFPSNLTFAAAGGNKVSLWDLRTAKPLFEGRNNKKIVSCVKVIKDGSRFITTSYDNYLKIYKADTFQLTHQQKIDSPITAFDITSTNQTLCLGLQSGKVLLKWRSEEDKHSEQDSEGEDDLFKWMKSNQTKKFAYNDQHFYRGIYQKSQNYDIKFQQGQVGKKVGIYDQYLKKFQYKEALIRSLQKKNMMIYLSLIDEYLQRGCLERVVKALTLNEAEKIVKWATPLIHNIKYSQTSILLLQKILQHHVGQWEELQIEIRKQLKNIEELYRLEGMLQILENSF